MEAFVARRAVRCVAQSSRLLGQRYSSHVPDRKSKFKTIDQDDVSFFETTLGSSSVLSTLNKSADAEELAGFNEDWMSKYKGTSTTVLKPKTTEQVSKLLAYCNQKSIAVVPQGGNTGLVGGSVPVHDELVISLTGLNKIRSFDNVSGILKADSGCILQTVDETIGKEGYIFPLDLGAKGTCHIGGNIATNAGGLRLLRYGSLHGSVLGLEVVLPDEKGTVLELGMNGLRKDNTGYDLKQLFIGAEGTLGIITGVTVLAPKRSTAHNVALLAVPTFETIKRVFVETRSQLGEILSAFEFFDEEALKMTLDHTGAQRPIGESETGEGQFYCLLETSGSNKDHDDEKLQGLLEKLLEDGVISDGVLAENETQLQSLWNIRESIPESAGKLGKTYKYDLSLPLDVMYSVVNELRAQFKSKGMDKDGDGSIKEIVGYGHIGDGNIHVNVIAKAFEPRIEEVIEPWIYQWVAENKGSISAEHGLGVMKAPYINYSQPEANVHVMRQIKALFDPKGILNPYKYFLEAEH